MEDGCDGVATVQDGRLGTAAGFSSGLLEGGRGVQRHRARQAPRGPATLRRAVGPRITPAGRMRHGVRLHGRATLAAATLAAGPPVAGAVSEVRGGPGPSYASDPPCFADVARPFRPLGRPA